MQVREEGVRWRKRVREIRQEGEVRGEKTNGLKCGAHKTLCGRPHALSHDDMVEMTAGF